MENILVLCAHNDDQIIGMGGTVAKFAKEGKRVHTVIFSYGEKGHPFLKKHILKRQRLREVKKSQTILGEKEITHLGIEEGKFLKNEKKIIIRIEKIIRKEKPSKVFTHSQDDPHPDHHAVFRIANALHQKMRFPLYTFEVWNILTIRHRNKPKLVIDTSDTHKIKIEAFRAHKSQKLAYYALSWKMVLKDFINGWSNDCRRAEVFIKVR